MAVWSEWKSPSVPPAEGDWDFFVSDGTFVMKKLVSGEWVDVASWSAGGVGPAGNADKVDGQHAAAFEPVFSKNTGFNKNFGTAAGTVAEGSHTHSGSDDSWHNVGGSGEPAFQNGWISMDGPVGFKLVNGIVYLRGRSGHSGGSDTTIFTLPAGYRPSYAIYNLAGGVISVDTSGNVKPSSAVSPALLNGLSFAL